MAVKYGTLNANHYSATVCLHWRTFFPSPWGYEALYWFEWRCRVAHVRAEPGAYGLGFNTAPRERVAGEPGRIVAFENREGKWSPLSYAVEVMVPM
jgi:hypothetical protein